MKNINKKSINLGLKILSISAFALMFMPTGASAYRNQDYYGQNYVYDSRVNQNYNSNYNSQDYYDQNYTYRNTNNGYNNYNYANYSYGNQIPINNVVRTNNPRPIINLITPASGVRSLTTKTITIIGNGFVPGSVAKVNGSSRPTTFIDYSRLLVQLNADDTYRDDSGFFITVSNMDGGSSNSAFFTLNNVATPVARTNNGSNSNNNSSPANNASSNAPARAENETGTQSDNTSNLASNVIFGTNSFLPSGLVQWVLFAIIILLIVILTRRILGHRENYLATPLKHD